MTAGVRESIVAGRTTLGIELGSTRIKLVLIAEDHTPVAVGVHEWENRFVDRIWTYPLEAVWDGLSQSFAALAEDVRERYEVELRTVAAMGVSAMMHGYLAFDSAGALLTPFRTWRNTDTGEAANRLSVAFGRNVPHRWSVAHLYQAILNGEEHVARIDHLTTLAGYVHWQLTGLKVLGVGDASGMLAIDSATGDYPAAMLKQFDQLAAEAGSTLSLGHLLPDVRRAGEPAGYLSEAGAARLDRSGQLQAGIPFCPPEGDAGTGMVATNSVAPRTGNVSAGTSIFAMVVLEKQLSRAHRELDLVTTPSGHPVAMVHCNNGASELDSWAGVFGEFATALGVTTDPGTVFEILFSSALRGAADGGGLTAFNYLAGEPITGLSEGRPLFLRSPNGRLTLANFIRAQLFSAFATLRLGMDVLQREESVSLDGIYAHGGLFKTKGVAQKLLAGAIDTPVSVGDTAAEGGAWGIALLAAFLVRREPQEDLAHFLAQRVFVDADLVTVTPDPVDVAGFEAFMQRYAAALPVERSAVEHTR